MTEMTMGQRIAQERKKLGLSQEGLGDKMGVSRQAISKWEADGAVPEIDKLIALSRLFSVSVGWLLGVEEMPKQAEDGLTEEQLKTMEELVKRYQPKPQKRGMKWAALGALGVCAVLFVILFTQIGGLLATDSWLSGSAEDLKNQISELQRSVNSLNAEVASANTSQNQLLSNYSFEISPLISIAGNDPAAQVEFSAVPGSWQEGDVGVLSIRCSGMETVQQECGWDGAFLTAAVPLEVWNGYELCFTITHADGTQEQQALSNYDVENLKTVMTVTAGATVGSAEYKDGTLTLRDCDISVEMPTVGYEYGAMGWSSVDLILYRNSTEIGRFSILTATADEELRLSPGMESYIAEISFTGSEGLAGLALTENDDIQLWISAELNNGLSAMNPVAYWVTDENLNLQVNHA